MAINHYPDPELQAAAEAEHKAKRAAHKKAQAIGTRPPDLVKVPKSKLTRGEL